jgi:hypothetical protein
LCWVRARRSTLNCPDLAISQACHRPAPPVLRRNIRVSTEYTYSLLHTYNPVVAQVRSSSTTYHIAALSPLSRLCESCGTNRNRRQTLTTAAPLHYLTALAHDTQPIPPTSIGCRRRPPSPFRLSPASVCVSPTMSSADTTADEADARRSSIEKKPIMGPDPDPVAAAASAHAPINNRDPPAFERLPDEIIQQYAPSFFFLLSPESSALARAFVFLCLLLYYETSLPIKPPYSLPVQDPAGYRCERLCLSCSPQLEMEERRPAGPPLRPPPVPMSVIRHEPSDTPSTHRRRRRRPCPPPPSVRTRSQAQLIRGLPEAAQNHHQDRVQLHQPLVMSWRRGHPV